jgi:mRNA interferase MazF
MTDWKERYANRSWMVKLTPDHQNGLTKDSGVDAFQIRSISHLRFIQKLGNVSDTDMEKIGNSLRIVLSLS